MISLQDIPLAVLDRLTAKFLAVAPVARPTVIDTKIGMALNQCQMTHEAQRPETYQTPETPLFNVDAMTDDQIVLLYRGLVNVYETEEVHGNEHDGVADGMITQLEASLSSLTSRDPERVRDLIANCILSNNDADRELALGVAASLVSYDYNFTRDTLLSLAMHGPDHIAEGADMQVIPRLMHDYLTPDQVADFNARLQAQGYDPIEPARTD